MNEENQFDTGTMENDTAGTDLTDAIDASWYDDSDTDTEEPEENGTDEGAEADQQSAGEPEEQAAGTEETGAEEKTDQFELKHLDETRTVSREEVIALAQKGMDYDRIRAKYDEYKAGEGQRNFRDSFLKELADSAGQSVEEMIDSARARMLMTKAATEGKELTEEQALAQARQDREASTAPKEEKPEETEKPKANPEEKRKESFLRFSREYPEVKAEDIPNEVWQGFAAGEGDLADLYARHENRQLKEQLAAMKQNEENRKKSTGSRKSAGSNSLSAFDAMWYDGT